MIFLHPSLSLEVSAAPCFLHQLQYSRFIIQETSEPRSASQMKKIEVVPGGLGGSVKGYRAKMITRLAPLAMAGSLSCIII